MVVPAAMPAPVITSPTRRAPWLMALTVSVVLLMAPVNTPMALGLVAGV